MERHGVRTPSPPLRQPAAEFGKGELLHLSTGGGDGCDDDDFDAGGAVDGGDAHLLADLNIFEKNFGFAHPIPLPQSETPSEEGVPNSISQKDQASNVTLPCASN